MAFIVSFVLFSYSSAFSIFPLRYLVTLDPGSAQIITVDVSNNENKTINVVPVVLGAEQNNAGQAVFSSGLTRAETWVKPNINSFELATGEEQKISFTITAPSTASPGSYYLAVGAQASSAGGQLGLDSQLLTLLTIQISGTAQEQLVIEQWQTNNFFVIKKDWNFHLNIKNAGNVEVPYSARLVVRNWRGDEKTSFDLIQKNNLLADTWKAGDYSSNVDNLGFWPGIYQAQVVVSYGLTQQMVTSMVYILYVPVWSWIVLGMAILVIIGAFTSQYKFQM